MVQVVEHSPVSSTDKLEKPKRAVQEAASPSSSLPRSTLPRWQHCSSQENVSTSTLPRARGHQHLQEQEQEQEQQGGSLPRSSGVPAPASRWQSSSLRRNMSMSSLNHTQDTQQDR